MSGLFGGGSSPKKPEPTEHEIALAEQGVQKWNRYLDRYAPLEEQELAGLGKSNQQRLAASTNSKLMQEASRDAMEALGSSNVTRGLGTLSRMNRAMSHASAGGRTASIINDRNRQDSERMGAIKRGLGIAGEQTQGLSALARQQSNQALTRYDIENKRNIQESNANVEALTGLAEAGGQAYFGSKMQDQQINRLGSMMYTSRYGGQKDFMGQLDASLDMKSW